MAIETLLIANRGEIALRVIRTARAMGIRTVAICTDLDAAAPHVRAADESVTVPSYLDIAAVVDAARRSRATAIHPGYGFLSERAEFARAVEEAGLKLVGPSAEVMEQMGRKDAARKIAVAAGVPVVPTGAGAAYPVLVKAAAGGGGKGMRIVRADDELEAAMEGARREALAAFGDDTLLVEKYVEHGRHIEVQVMADAHGNVIHLFERDCSSQRRHQKVLEEAPAPTIGAETRQLVTDSAVALAKQVGYENAGTVEFLLDTDSGEAYFLEMNTRLQVEHPVTELVTGLDLVELQLRVAAGEPLPISQDDVALSGHAIEARVYAEDPYAGFLPQAGTATYVHWVESSSGTVTVRTDHALESGQVVSTSYDPMLGKVIAHGPDRETARRALAEALADTAILGLATNTGFLRSLVESEEFAMARIDTSWLDQAELHGPDDEAAGFLATWAQLVDLPRSAADPFRSDGWRLGAAPGPVLIDGRIAAWSVTDHSALIGGYALREISRRRGPVARFEVAFGCTHDDDPERACVEHLGGPRHVAYVQVRPHEVEVVDNGQRHVLPRADAFGDHGPVAGDGVLLAPMPGTVLSVDVVEGDRVTEGQRLGVLEAMKMELALTAPFDGTVTAVGAATGDQVQLKQLLFEVELDV